MRQLGLRQRDLDLPEDQDPERIGQLEDDAEVGGDERRHAPAELEERPEDEAAVHRRENRAQIAR